MLKKMIENIYQLDTIHNLFFQTQISLFPLIFLTDAGTTDRWNRIRHNLDVVTEILKGNFSWY